MPFARFGQIVGFTDPNLYSKFLVQILSRFKNINNSLLLHFLQQRCKKSPKLENFIRPHQNQPHKVFGNANHFITIQSRFLDIAVQKSKYCRTFLSIELKCIDLPMIILIKLSVFFISSPSPNFKLLTPAV